MKIYNLWKLMTLLGVLILASCEQNTIESKRAVIKGDYFPFEERVFLNRVTANNVKTIDSVDITMGEPFSFSVRSDDYGIYRLAHKDLFPIMVVVKNGDTVMIEQTTDKAWPYKVEGPEECMLMVNYLERLNRDQYKVDSLSAIFLNSQDNPDFLNIRNHLNQEFIKLHEDHKEYARQFVKSHPASIAAIAVINSFFKEFALFNHQEDFEYYNMIDESLMARMPNNKHVIDFHQQVEDIRASNEYELEARMRLTPGRIIPDFELPSTSGTKVGPKDFRESVLLIYFWAGADAKSRQTNPLIKAAYDSFSPVGFKVLNVSFDKDPKVWEQAIKLDGLPGVHVTDLKGAGSPVQRLFNLKMKLPYYFLVDTKGRIFDHDADFEKLANAIVDIYNTKPE